jgi:hypothetical protein
MKRGKKKNNRRIPKNTTNSLSSQNKSEQEVPEEVREPLDESIEEILFVQDLK